MSATGGARHLLGEGSSEPHTPSLLEPLLDSDAVAVLLGVPATWVRSEARAGRMPSIKLGHYRRFVRAEVVAWLEQQRGAR